MQSESSHEEKTVPIEVPWFPTKLSDFDEIGKKVLVFGDGIEEIDHPGCKDPEYKKRRAYIAEVALNHKFSEDTDLPRLKYSDDEIGVWKYCYSRLKVLFKANACKEYNWAIDQFEKHVGFTTEEIPQLDDISKFLHKTTGFRLRPVGGLLTQREFLNALAFRIFHSTQYIRHHDVPMYSPEPDIIHELVGHTPMLAIPEFAHFSQQIGLASLGATDDDLMKLAAIYWFTIEFGICLQDDGSRKAYGAGILGGLGELKYCLTDVPKFYPLDLDEISKNHLNFCINAM